MEMDCTKSGAGKRDHFVKSIDDDGERWSRSRVDLPRLFVDASAMGGHSPFTLFSRSVSRRILRGREKEI